MEGDVGEAVVSSSWGDFCDLCKTMADPKLSTEAEKKNFKNEMQNIKKKKFVGERVMEQVMEQAIELLSINNGADEGDLFPEDIDIV